MDFFRLWKHSSSKERTEKKPGASEDTACYLAKTVLELEIFLPLPPEFWDYKQGYYACIPLCFIGLRKGLTWSSYLENGANTRFSQGRGGGWRR